MAFYPSPARGQTVLTVLLGARPARLSYTIHIYLAVQKQHVYLLGMGGLPWPGTVLVLLLNHKNLRGKNISLLHTSTKSTRSDVEIVVSQGNVRCLEELGSSTLPAHGKDQHPAQCCLVYSSVRKCCSYICSRGASPSLLGS